MIHRICIDSREKNSEARVIEKRIHGMGYNADVEVSHVYTVNHDFSEKDLLQIVDALHNPVVHICRIDNTFARKFDWALELGFLPGVTDNVANTTAEIINDLFKMNLGRNKVFSSRVLFISSKNLIRTDVRTIALELVNPLIERCHVKSYMEYVKSGGMERFVPEVRLSSEQRIIEVDLDIGDEELNEIGKKGIMDPETKARRGPLALDIDFMHAIKNYFLKDGRNPTDIELESIAQTWSEHCKHTIFSAQMDDIKEGIFRKYIKTATDDIRKSLGRQDFCVSIFTDNSGAIVFDDEHLITHKIETHNSPSALDPFGGSITGIVGVNRDAIGFGLGAMPIANIYGFCFGRPEDRTVLYRGKNKFNPALPPKRILDGVVHGVNVGGNCSGIPTPCGFLYFDDSYKGKPLVFVGTVGLIPRRLEGMGSSHEKNAQPNDNIVVVGGRVGKDGVHGATFSSEALNEGSPATAVQIGDPITQKKLSDALVKEARDMALYNSITDNGAGGLSCSVAEMAKECGGFVVELDKVPLKYPGLQPWEIWVSESQERMTLAVPDEKLKEFLELMESRGVECAVIGRFNLTNRAIVNWNGKKIMDLDMEFLHDGLPKRKLVTEPYPYISSEPEILIKDYEEILLKIIGSHNNCSYEFISKQYDHEVQGGSIIKPLQGRGRVNGDAYVIRPVFGKDTAIALSHALYPKLSEIDAYAMAACAIDTAIRNCVAVGGDVKHMALLDNFCWCSSNDAKRLFQLKEAARACYDITVAFQTPWISGKDSMFNDFIGFDEQNNQIKISILPTLLVSAIGVIKDALCTTTMELKVVGDLLYVIGETLDECGGSELCIALNEKGGRPPRVNAASARSLYEMMYVLHQKDLLSACAPVNRGGIGVTLAKMSIAGQMGVEVDITKATQSNLSAEKILFSESQSRFIVSIDSSKQREFEECLEGFTFGCVGMVSDDDKFVINHGNKKIIDLSLEKLDEAYRERFKDF